MEIRNLKGVGNNDILNVFNDSFADYLIPFKLSEDQLISKMKTDKTDLELSVGVFEGKRIIAFVLHGFDTNKGQYIVYNGGTGVLPEKRGLGLTKKMYQFVLPHFEKNGIDKVILEVIEENIAAIKSYEHSGFTKTRKLACYRGKFTPQKSNPTTQIVDLQHYEWNLLESFWEINTTWQNSIASMDLAKTKNKSLGAYIKNQLVGYIIFNPENKRIQQIAVHIEYRRRGIGTTLIAELAKTYGNSFSVINIDTKAKSITRFFDSIGFKNYLNQLEMELKIKRT